MNALLKTVVLGIMSLVVAVAMSGIAVAQQFPYLIDTRPARGILPNTEQLAGTLDAIDPVGNGMHLEVPLASLPLGPGGSGFDLSLVYESRLFDLDPINVVGVDERERVEEFLKPSVGGGWNYNFRRFDIEEEVRRLPPDSGGCGTAIAQVEKQRMYRYRLYLPDGTQHILHLLSNNANPNPTANANYWGDGFYGFTMDGTAGFSCLGSANRKNQTLTYYTNDGSFLRLLVSADAVDSNWATAQTWTLFFPDGRLINGVGRTMTTMIDEHNNALSFSGTVEAGNVVTYISDGLMRSIRIEYGAESADLKIDKISVLGPQGLLEWRVTWQKYAISGKAYYCSTLDICHLNYSQWNVKSIALPFSATAQVQFDFEARVDGPWWGQLSRMTTPNGAVYIYGCCNAVVPRGFITNDAERIAHSGYSSRTILHDGATETWIYAGNTASGIRTSQVTAPDGGVTTYSSYDPQLGTEAYRQGLVFRIEDPAGTVTKRLWNRNAPDELTSATASPNNPFVERESVTVNPVAGASRSVVTDYAYDRNGNLIRKAEYSWSPYQQGQQTLESPGSLLRQTDLSYFLNTTLPLSANTRYWQPGTPRRLLSPTIKTVSGRTGTAEVLLKSKTEYVYETLAPCQGCPQISRAAFDGLYQKEIRYDNTRAGCSNTSPMSEATCLVLKRNYALNGNLTAVFEPEVPAELSYGGGSPYPTKIDYGIPVTRSFSYIWDVPSGGLVSQKDLQNDTTTLYGYDTYGRLKTVTEARMRRTRTDRYEQTRQMRVQSDLRSLHEGDAEGELQTITHYDQLGRTDLVRTSDGAPLVLAGANGIKVKSVYGTLPGATFSMNSSPYRSASDTTLEWSCTQRDTAGRPVAIATYSGAEPTLPLGCMTPGQTGRTTLSYGFDASKGLRRVTTIDPAGRTMDRLYDALGRLATVIEAPGSSKSATTTYEYDPLDKLTRVLQGPTGQTPQQQREFEYTSLGQLKLARNPESGDTEYTYRGDGALATRKDSRGIVTSYWYDDPLHRLTGKTYNDTTPEVRYAYHSSMTPGCRNAGQLWTVSSSVAETTSGCYDPLGRVLNQTQEIRNGGPIAVFLYSYYLNDQIKTTVYPSGLMLSTDVDNAGRVTRLEKIASPQNRTYADLTTADAYAPDRRIARAQLGNGLWETWTFRAPGTQPTLFRLTSEEGTAIEAKLEMHFGFVDTLGRYSGNLETLVTRHSGKTWAQRYEYDDLDRLACVGESSGNPPASCAASTWRQGYGYDVYGNRWVDPATSSSLPNGDIHEPTASTNFLASNNRLSPAIASYDTAGNQQLYPPWTLLYDAENRNTRVLSGVNDGCVTQASGCGVFAYDGNGRRVKKEWTPAGGTRTTTYFIYDVMGRLAVEYSTVAAPVGTAYIHSDMLGSTRMVTGEKPAGGTAPILECYDYLPFGRLMTTANFDRLGTCLPSNLDDQVTSHPPQRFTGKERDAETKLDCFGARYYSSAAGRFTSADAPFADQHPENPQTWNLYAYVRNRPLTAIDPTGRAQHDPGKMEPTCGGADKECSLGPGGGAAGGGYLKAGTFSLSRLRAAVRDFLLGANPAAERGMQRTAPEVARLESGTKAQSSQNPLPQYPPNNGFSGTSARQTLNPGAHIDRFGSDLGRFASPEGTPWEQRSLPGASASAPYSVFEVMRPLEVQAGPVAPWFGVPGGGIQYYLPASVDELIKDGVLKRVNR